MKTTEKTILEQFIDSYGVDGVAQAIDEICLEKAAHVRENWQDEKLAKEWERKSNAIYTLLRKLDRI